MVEFWNTLAFVVFPYVSITICILGNLYRFAVDPYRWNAKSSEIFEKRTLLFASNLFHYGILLALMGHVMGLLIPQSVYDAFWISGELHTAIAYFLGIAFGMPALIGLALLILRRNRDTRVLAITTKRDHITAALLLITVGVGTYNVLFGHYYVLDTVAPWLRGILTFRPNTSLLADVPFLYKLHILSAFALFAFAPFSRLVHIWSAPLSYVRRSYILFRKRCPEP
jgi:nitrate reductase gamma subunit